MVPGSGKIEEKTSKDGAGVEAAQAETGAKSVQAEDSVYKQVEQLWMNVLCTVVVLLPLHDALMSVRLFLRTKLRCKNNSQI